MRLSQQGVDLTRGNGEWLLTPRSNISATGVIEHLELIPNVHVRYKLNGLPNLYDYLRRLRNYNRHTSNDFMILANMLANSINHSLIQRPVKLCM